MKSNILLTGGSGLLGTELQKYLNCYAPSHEEFNLLDPYSKISFIPDVILHCAAYTDLVTAEIDKQSCYTLNVGATRKLALEYPQAYFVYISSEYAHNPVNYYAKTKLWGENMVTTYAPHHLIIRTLFKSRPFPYKYAFADQYTTGDYVDIIAPLIVNSILQHLEGRINIGTGRKSMFELARRSNPTILGNSIHDIKDVVLPGDYL